MEKHLKENLIASIPLLVDFIIIIVSTIVAEIVELNIIFDLLPMLLITVFHYIICSHFQIVSKRRLWLNYLLAAILFVPLTALDIGGELQSTKNYFAVFSISVSLWALLYLIIERYRIVLPVFIVIIGAFSGLAYFPYYMYRQKLEIVLYLMISIIVIAMVVYELIKLKSKFKYYLFSLLPLVVFEVTYLILCHFFGASLNYYDDKKLILIDYTNIGYLILLSILILLFNLRFRKLKFTSWLNNCLQVSIIWVILRRVIYCLSHDVFPGHHISVCFSITITIILIITAINIRIKDYYLIKRIRKERLEKRESNN